MTTTIKAANRSLPLLTWLSPGFPVGAFAYSHGLEWAVESGGIVDAASLRLWLADLLSFGAPRNDAILIAQTYAAIRAGNAKALRDINELALALASSRERHLETSAQGRAFLTIIRAAWPSPVLDLTHALDDGDIAYPIAFGAACAAHDCPLLVSLESFLLAFVSNLVSAALRLGPIGQTDGQKIIAGFMPQIAALARAAQSMSLDDIGGCALRSDIAALAHETQYSRLFRS